MKPTWLGQWKSEKEVEQVDRTSALPPDTTVLKRQQLTPAGVKFERIKSVRSSRSVDWNEKRLVHS